MKQVIYNNNLTIVCPIHMWDDSVNSYTAKMVKSLLASSDQYFDLLFISATEAPFTLKENVSAHATKKWFNSHNTQFITLNEDLNYQAVVNRSLEYVQTDYFMVLEFDDVLEKEYIKTLEQHIKYYNNIDVFLNIVFEVNERNEMLGLRNDYAWLVNAMDRIGYVNFNGMKNNFGPFSLVGAVINKNFFSNVGKLKEKFEVSFNHEFLLRALDKGGEVYVIPQIGVKHTNGRDNSYFSNCAEKFTTEQKNDWYKAALRLCHFTEDTIVKF